LVFDKHLLKQASSMGKQAAAPAPLPQVQVDDSNAEAAKKRKRTGVVDAARRLQLKVRSHPP